MPRPKNSKRGGEKQIEEKKNTKAVRQRGVKPIVKTKRGDREDG
jgi:hypothetical protein